MAETDLYNIFLVDIPYDDENTVKYRPGLLILPEKNISRIFKITSRKIKSARIQAIYYPINDWRAAGLSKVSFVDTHTTYSVPTRTLMARKLLGHLSDADAIGLANFITEHQSEIAIVHKETRQEILKKRPTEEYLKRRGLNK
uniref:hypothetical protein n=1 Tax=Lentilactobacillus hilgardii TaxID=1588 RepID=UPI00403F7188